MSTLSAEDARQRLGALPDWKIVSGELVKTFQFKDFRTAIAFVNQVAELAEEAAHHPDIDIRYNRVQLALTTHDAGGLTPNDFDLATLAEKLL
jgi:4a-hydroxytetrahydrobiopterin dehydratase